MAIDTQRLLRAYETARRELLNERVAQGHWVGQLSSSAAATASAVSALALVQPHLAPSESASSALPRSHHGLMQSSVRWLVSSQNHGAQNDDGGWGDTDRSPSNIATTMLVQSALVLTGSAGEHRAAMKRADVYVAMQGGVPALRRSSIDKTLAEAVTMNAAIAGRVPWSEVTPLPFETACLPASWRRSRFGLPLLVAVGQAKFFHDPPKNQIVRGLRSLSMKRSLDAVERMQSASGAFLDSALLTSFVVMSLASMGHADHPIAQQSVEFLRASMRPDGSWPIDTNLATWLTTLSMHALSASDAPETFNWLMSCQHRDRHPLTGAMPGGWARNDLSDGIPDVDNTAGALIALAKSPDIADQEGRLKFFDGVQKGTAWLLKLQNGNGGWPPFCREWGKLRVDRSGADLTAHALRALGTWRDPNPKFAAVNIDRAIARGLRFLSLIQRPDGSWTATRFDDEHEADGQNPIYGTSRVVLAWRQLGLAERPECRRGLAWLVANQNIDGGWGGASPDRAGDDVPPESTVEETALAVEALAGAPAGLPLTPAMTCGVEWLVRRIEQGEHLEPSPIGLTFAGIWYYERLYPLIFTVSALGRVVEQLVPSEHIEPFSRDVQRALAARRG